MIATYGPTGPPKRSPIPVPHLSAGRHLAARRYVVGWVAHDLAKIGCTSGRVRVQRFTRTPGAELIDLAYYSGLCDGLHSETWLERVAGSIWPPAFECKDDARFLLGNDTGGWMEFLRVPAEDWPELRRLAAI